MPQAKLTSKSSTYLNVTHASLSFYFSEIDTDGVIQALTNAKNVIVVPGYGLCAARAQYPVSQIADLLTKKGINFRFGIHPVAGQFLIFRDNLNTWNSPLHLYSKKPCLPAQLT